MVGPAPRTNGGRSCSKFSEYGRFRRTEGSRELLEVPGNPVPLAGNSPTGGQLQYKKGQRQKHTGKLTKEGILKSSMDNWFKERQ